VKTTRRLRFLAALLTLASVLFAQLAIAAYACPGAASMAAAAEVEAMPGCDMSPADDAPSALCLAHCLQGDQSPAQPLLAAAAMAMIVESPFAAFAPAPRAEIVGARALQSFLERPTEPELALRHCRLRI
jgi:hypothetical protein